MVGTPSTIATWVGTPSLVPPGTTYVNAPKGKTSYVPDPNPHVDSSDKFRIRFRVGFPSESGSPGPFTARKNHSVVSVPIEVLRSSCNRAWYWLVRAGKECRT